MAYHRDLPTQPPPYPTRRSSDLENLPYHRRTASRPRRRRHGRPEGAGMTTHEHADGKAIDPVCGMTVNPATTPHHATHDGTDYHFCSAGCRTKFLADPRSEAAARGARMQRRMLAHDGVRADDELGILAGELEVLRLAADRGERKHPGVGPERGAARHHPMRLEPAAVGETGLGPDHAVRAGPPTRPQLGPGSHHPARVAFRPLGLSP